MAGFVNIHSLFRLKSLLPPILHCCVLSILIARVVVARFLLYGLLILSVMRRLARVDVGGG